MAQPLMKLVEDKIDPESEFPHITSYSELARDLQDREALFLETQGTILNALTKTPKDKKIFRELEAQTSNEAQKTLQLCKAINQRAWVHKGITDDQHEKAGEKAQRIFKEFKDTADELRKTREQKKKEHKFSLLEFNAALLLAPLAAYGFLKVHFPEAENEALCKNVSIIVAGVEIAYVFRKDAANVWRASLKEITKQKDKAPLSLFPTKENLVKAGAKIMVSIKEAGKSALGWAGKRAPVRTAKRIKQLFSRKKDF